jgi:hypothetical protein
MNHGGSWNFDWKVKYVNAIHSSFFPTAVTEEIRVGLPKENTNIYRGDTALTMDMKLTLILAILFHR